MKKNITASKIIISTLTTLLVVVIAVKGAPTVAMYSSYKDYTSEIEELREKQSILNAQVADSINALNQSATVNVTDKSAVTELLKGLGGQIISIKAYATGLGTSVSPIQVIEAPFDLNNLNQDIDLLEYVISVNDIDTFVAGVSKSGIIVHSIDEILPNNTVVLRVRFPEVSK